MNADHQLVKTFLKEVLGEEHVPSYQLSTEGLSVLVDLARSDRDDKRRTDVLNDVRRRQALEYGAEADRMKRGLSEVGLESVDGPVKELATVLAETAAKLDVDDPWQIAPALAEVERAAAKAPVATMERQQDENRMKAKQREAVEALAADRAALRKAEREAPASKEAAVQWAKKIGFMREKRKEYAKSAAKREQQLAEVGAPNGSSTLANIRHEAILDSADQKAKLEEELLALREKLSSYRSLPPDPTLAAAKLAEAEAELAELTHTLNQQVSALHIH